MYKKPVGIPLKHALSVMCAVGYFFITHTVLAQTITSSHASTGAAARDPLTAMFAWWNDAIKTPGALTPEAFGKYFTDDGAIIVNGKVFAKGLPALSAHFEKIQAAGGSDEIVLPFMKTFRSGNDIYTYHIIRIERNEEKTCLLVAGHAVVRSGKLAEVTLVRTKVDATTISLCEHS